MEYYICIKAIAVIALCIFTLGLFAFVIKHRKPDGHKVDSRQLYLEAYYESHHEWWWFMDNSIACVLRIVKHLYTAHIFSSM